MSLRNRVAIAGGAVVLAALAVASLVLYPALRARLVQQRDASLAATASQSPDLLKALKTKTAAVGADLGTGTKPVTIGSTLVQFVPPPVTEGPADGLGPISSRDVQVATGQTPAYFSYGDYNGRRYRVYTAVLADTGGGLVRTALPVSVDAPTLRRLVALLVALTLGGALLAAAAGRLAAGRVLRPVQRLTDTVEHVAATQDLTATIEARGRDEIGRLARSFATMMAELDESVQTQRRLVADA
ncbi:MAG TPA: HAMP domain-containing protein, partial [Streptosporangiaceae bacterium]